MAKPPYDDCVFINCPFGEDYENLFHAIVFAVSDCGFIARCALESSDSSEVRLEKLFRIISECRYGVHDISATELDSTNKLPRFNMPLELGIFLGAKKYGSPQQRKKSCIVLDRERYRYQKFCSDIAGQDPKAHNNDPMRAIRCIRDWIRGERKENILPSGSRMCERYQMFRSSLPLVCDGMRLDPNELQFNDLTAVVDEWLRLNSW